MDAERVVVFFGDFGLVSYDHDGREQWRTPLGPFDNVYGMGSSPILAEGLVVLGCDQSLGSFVAAFDAETGRERWRTPRPEALSGHSTPVVLERQGAPTQLVLPGSFRLDAYDLRTGASAWFANGLPSEMKSGAVLDGNAVYVVGYGSPLNEPGQQPKLPPYAEWRAAQDQDKDGRVTRAEADATSREYFDFIDLDKDGAVSESEWKMNQAMMGAENGLLAFRSDLTGDVTRSGLLWQLPALGAAAADARALPRRPLHDQRRRHPHDARPGERDRAEGGPTARCRRFRTSPRQWPATARSTS